MLGGDDDGQPVGEQVGPRRGVEQTGLRHHVHLRFIRADEQIHRRPFDDLARERVRRAEVEPDRPAAILRVCGGDLLQHVREADRGGHRDRFGRRRLPPGPGASREKDGGDNRGDMHDSPV